MGDILVFGRVGTTVTTDRLAAVSAGRFSCGRLLEVPVQGVRLGPRAPTGSWTQDKKTRRQEGLQKQQTRHQIWPSWLVSPMSLYHLPATQWLELLNIFTKLYKQF